MIGNDIVDLKQSPSYWKNPRFLEKVFIQKEQDIINRSEDQHQMLWLLWSMKESAYKCHVQQYGVRFFNPKRLVCELISEDKGIVTIDDNWYYTDSTITRDYVYTIAKLNESKVNLSSVFKAEISTLKIQSDSLKIALLQSISKTEHIALQDLEIIKTEIGVPQLFNKSTKLSKSLSLTHCGRFSGFVYC